MPMKHIVTAALTATVTLLVTGVASAATVTLHDTKGPPTAKFTVNAAGFTAGEAVTFTFAPGGKQTVTAGGDGAAVTTFTAWPAHRAASKLPVAAPPSEARALFPGLQPLGNLFQPVGMKVLGLLLACGLYTGWFFKGAAWASSSFIVAYGYLGAPFFGGS